MKEIALTIEDDHWVLAAIEHIDVVAAINTDAADLLEGPAVGYFAQSALTRYLNWPLPPIIESPSSDLYPLEIGASRCGR